MTDKNKGQFSSENQPRRKRGPAKKNLLIQALKRKECSEEEFYNRFVALALDSDYKHQFSVMKEIIDRLMPTERPHQAVFEFDFPRSGTPVEQVDAIMSAVALGDLPADIAKNMADIIARKMNIMDNLEMMREVEELKEIVKDMQDKNA